MTELEKEIVGTVKRVLINGIIESSKQYDNPIRRLVIDVIECQREELKILLQDTINEVVKSESFKEEIKKVIGQTLTREVLNSTDGGTKKLMNKLKQDKIFRAKLALAVDNLINEFAKESE